MFNRTFSTLFMGTGAIFKLLEGTYGTLLILYTTPFPVAPPIKAVPYRLPARSRIRPPYGVPPSVPPVNVYSRVSLPCLSSLNTVPQPAPPHAVFPPADVVP